MATKGYRQPLWIRLTAVLCLELMFFTLTEPAVATVRRAREAVTRQDSRSTDTQSDASAPKTTGPGAGTQGQSDPPAPDEVDGRGSTSAETSTGGTCLGSGVRAIGAIEPTSRWRSGIDVSDLLPSALPQSLATIVGQPDLSQQRVFGMPGAFGPPHADSKMLGMLEGEMQRRRIVSWEPSASQCQHKAPPAMRAAHPTIVDEHAPFGQVVEPAEGATLRFDGAMLVVPPGALSSPTRITIHPIADKEAGVLDEGMANVVPGHRAYRLGPHGLWFQKPITIVIPYDQKLIPRGLSDQDMGTFYFDSEAGSWQRVPVREVLSSEGLVVAETEHFTDFLNATLAVPDHPTAASFDANTIKNLKIGDPTSGLELVAPPSGASDGAAHLSYKFIVPPGRHGLNPDLQLAYNSESANSWVGLGWNVDVSRIRVDTRFGVPRYDTAKESELYTVDGAELTPLGATSAPQQRARNPESRQAERKFVQRVEGSFHQIVRHGSSPNTYWWELTDRNGTHFRYGKDSGSVLSDPDSGRIAEWALTEVDDTFGNRITYEYQFDDGQLESQKWRQIYPKRIRYTDHGSAIGAMYLQFELDDTDAKPSKLRPDVFSSARYGFLVRTRRTLHAVYVSYSPNAAPPDCSDTEGSKSVRRYLFTYRKGEFGKTLLDTVATQDWSSTGGENQDYAWKTDHETSFDYYARQEDPRFESSASWGTVAANQTMGHSEGESAGANLFAGIAPVGVCNAFHAGIGGGLSQGTESSNRAFFDINGDGLPDFLSSGQASYGHRDPGGSYLSASLAQLSGPFSNTNHSTLSLNAGVHVWGELGSAGANWSWSNSTQNGGFADINGDGYVDWVTPLNAAFRNNGDVTVTFSDFSQKFSGKTTELSDDIKAQINQQYPRADTLVRWLAPYHGDVRIGGAVQRKVASGGTVLAEIWRNGETQTRWSNTFSSGDATVCAPGNSNSCTGGLTIPVEAGDRLYFRTAALDDLVGTALTWDPQISYQTVCQQQNCSPVAEADHARLEPWGAPVFDFSQKADFRLAGPPARPWSTAVLSSVQVSVDGVFKKLAPTADDVTVQVVQKDALQGTSTVLVSQTIGAAQTANIDIACAIANAGGGPPVPPPCPVNLTVSASADLDSNGIPTTFHADSLEFRVLSDSPVDPSAFDWDPVVHYLQYCRRPATENSTLACGDVSCPAGDDNTECTMANDPLPDHPLRRGAIFQHAQPSYPTFLVLGAGDGVLFLDNMPTTPWAAPESGPFRATITYGLGAGDPGTNAVILVQGNQRLLAKQVVNPGTSSSAMFTGLAATAGEPLYFTGLRKGTQPFQFSVQITFDATGHSFAVPASALNLHHELASTDTQQQPVISGNYHQWSMGQWNGNIAFSGDLVESAPTVSENDPSAGKNVPFQLVFPQAFGIPQRPEQDIPGIAAPVWISSGIDLYIASGEMKPSRIGANPLAVIAAAQAPAFRKSHGSDSGASISVAGSLSVDNSDSDADVDFIDLNGDRYPDSFDTGTVRYGDGEGAFPTEQPVDFGGPFRHIKTRYARYGLGLGSGAAGLSKLLSPSGNVNSFVSVLPSLGRAYGRTTATTDLIDINGDGLPDRLERSDPKGKLSVRLNLGYQFGPAFQIDVPAFGKTIGSEVLDFFTAEDGEEGFLRVETNVNNSFQFGYGGIGGGLAYNGTRTVVDFADINGDGLPDRVMKIPGDSSLHVMLNLGDGFAPEEPWQLPAWGSELPSGGPLSSLGSNDTLTFSEGSEFHLGAGPPPITIPVFFVCVVLEASEQYSKTHTTAQLAFEDVNGDGFADQVLKVDNTGEVHVKLNHEGLQHYNLLRTVKNPLGGQITLDYQRQGNTQAMPHNQWVLSSVTTDDGLTGTFHDPARTTTFSYDGGLYVRSERESYGYATVTTTRPDQSQTIQSFHQNAYCSKELLTKTIERDSAGHLFRVEQTIYQNRSSNTPDSCFAAPTNEITSFYDGTTTSESQAKQVLEEQRDYDEFGNVTFYSNAGDVGTTDDVSYSVTYDPTLSKNYIFRADHVRALDAQNTALRERWATYYSSGALKTLHDVVSGGHEPDSGEPYDEVATPDWQFDYDEYGNPNTVTDPSGFSLGYEYDNDTHTYAVQTTDGFGYVSTAVPDPSIGVYTSITDINGQTETFDYGVVKPFLEFVRAPLEYLGGTTNTISVSYSEAKNNIPAHTVVKHIDADHPGNGTTPGEVINTVTFVDGFGRVIQTKKEVDVDNGQGGVTHGYSVSGLVVFDERGRVQEQGQPIFDTGGDEILATVNLVNPTHHEYDILSRPTKITQPNTGETTIAYGFATFDGATRATITATDPNQYARVTYQDIRGQTVGIEQTNTIAGTDKKLITHYAYNPLGELLKVTDAKQNVTTATYDTVGHLSDLVSPDMGKTSWRYDLEGRLRAKETANLRDRSQLIRYEYEFNRLTTVDLPSTTEVDIQYTYGLATDPEGGRGRITHVEDPSGGEDRYYDELGHVKKSVFSPTPQSTYAPQYSYTTQYTYDSLGRLLTLVYPDNESVVYHYDGGGALYSVTGTQGSRTTKYVQSITYDELGQRKSIKLGNGAVSRYTYDPKMRWMSDIQTDVGGSTIQKQHYTFDLVGTIKTAGNQIAVPAPVGSGTVVAGPTSSTYGYDKLYQLTSASGTYEGCACGCNNKRQYTFSQNYDEIGNITRKAQTDKIVWPTGKVEAQTKTTYTADYKYTSTRPHAATTIGTQTLKYDSDGNQLSSTGTFESGRQISWDDLDQLSKEVDSGYTNTFVYNAAGERTHKRRTSIETVYVNQYYTVRSSLFQTKHIYAGATRVASSTVSLSQADPPTPGSTAPIFFYYHSDNLGSTGYTSDANGKLLQHDEYFPGGEVWFEEVANGNTVQNRLPYLFNSKELDETGFYYYGARYYNPRSGQWVSPDPILAQYVQGAPNNGVFEPINLALYTQSMNSPLVMRDDRGAYAFPVLMAAGLAFASVTLATSKKEAAYAAAASLLGPIATGGLDSRGVWRGPWRAARLLESHLRSPGWARSFRPPRKSLCPWRKSLCLRRRRLRPLRRRLRPLRRRLLPRWPRG